MKYPRRRRPGRTTSVHCIQITKKKPRLNLLLVHRMRSQSGINHEPQLQLATRRRRAIPISTEHRYLHKIQTRQLNKKRRVQRKSAIKAEVRRSPMVEDRRYNLEKTVGTINIGTPFHPLAIQMTMTPSCCDLQHNYNDVARNHAGNQK